MRFENICRTCLGDGMLFSIFNAQERLDKSTISCKDMLLACASIPISEDDGFPHQICGACYNNLCSAYKFRRLCESSFSNLQEFAAGVIDRQQIKEEQDDTFVDSTSLEMEVSQMELKNETFCLKSEDDVRDANESSGFDDDIISPVKLNKVNVFKALGKAKKRIKKLRRDKSQNKQSKPHLETLTCSLCPKKFKQKNRLVAHQDFHIGIKRYFCEKCGKSYRNEKDHLSMHRRGNNYKCDFCSKCFNTKAKLSIHTETHSIDRERVFCNVEGCNKSFLSITGLDRHSLSHIGLKNFICHLCSKSFIDKYQLEVHIRIHTNERPFSCTICGKTFITSSARVLHERWHTKTRNYPCEYCNKSFVSSSGRKRHLLSHSKEQEKSCRFCGKKFSRDDNKKRHEMAMHSMTDDKCDGMNPFQGSSREEERRKHSPPSSSHPS